MKHSKEYRRPDIIRRMIERINKRVSRRRRIMEVCGGQTHSIIRYGLDQALPADIELIHGPGCPVCVTAEEKIDAAIKLAKQKNVILCCFGDILRVPGHKESLFDARASGAKVQVIYSPLEVIDLAQRHREKEIVYFAIGFETTAPANAMLFYLARKKNLKNISAVLAQVRVLPAMQMILEHERCEIDAFLAAGHVCTITGFEDYHQLALDHKIPIVVSGFEPADLLLGIECCISMLESGRYGLRNEYSRSVKERGNSSAKSLIREVFKECDMPWRGLGNIKLGGYTFTGKYQSFAAAYKSPGNDKRSISTKTSCRAADVLLGIIKPSQCPHFNSACSPSFPLGAPMVSSEGACAAYFNNR